MERLVEDAIQLHDVKAKVLLFPIEKGPVMYIGIPLADPVALKMDRCITKDALFTSKRFTSITSFV